MKRLLVACVMFFALSAGDAPAQGATLFVATSGSDANPGTAKKPFATLARARDAIREMKAAGGLPDGGVTVEVRPGTYYLTEPLEFTAEDSGTEEAPIVYRARRGKAVRLSGARVIAPSHLRPVTDAAVLRRLDEAARGHVLSLDLKAEGIDYLPELPDTWLGFTGNYPVMLEVFSGDERMTLARWPDEGFAHFDEIIDTGSGLRDPSGPKRPGVFTYTGDRPERWNVDEGVWLLGYWARAYVCDVCRVGSIDTGKKQISLAVPLRYGLDLNGAKRFFALNLLEELDRPGEWYLDRKAGVLYLWPPRPVKRFPVTISMLKEPMVSIKDASHITLRGMVLEGGRWDAVSITGGDCCRVVGCTIRNVGHNAVTISGGRDCGVVGCDIHHVGYRGIELSGGDRTTLTPCNHYAVNNHIHDCSVIRRTHAGDISLRGVGCRAAHNLIHHEPHTALWYAGNDHVMEYNEIYWTMTETAEGGVIYTGRHWDYRGNVIRYNYIHHTSGSVEGSPSRVNILHLDDCVSGTTFYGNVCWLASRGVSICGGPDNIVDNNIFVTVNPGVSLSTRGLSWYTWHRREDGTVYAIDTRTGKESTTMLRSLRGIDYQKPPWTKYPHLADMLSPERDPVGAPWYCRITRNIGVDGKLLQIAPTVKPEWAVIERNWEENRGDPGFVDLAAGDLRLREDAPVYRESGFDPIPFDEIGLIKDDTRASWPVRAEPPPADYSLQWVVQREQEKKMPTALPVFAVRARSAPIVIDGAVNPAEWDPEDATVRQQPAMLQWTATGEKSPLPDTAWIESDDAALYVAFVCDLNPQHGVSGGHTWGKDDAVEIALAVAGEGELGDIMILRGYSDGHFESSDEAGAPRSLTERVIKGVQYACRVEGKQRWTSEWRIPWSSLGVDPASENPRMLFNLSVRKPADNLWVTWKQPRGYTWDVRHGGVLWLSAFGDVMLSGGMPSQARIDVRAVTEGVTLKPLKTCTVATGARPPGSRLTGSSDSLGTEWEEFTYSFEADRDGTVRIELMGRAYINPVINDHVPVWTCWDDMTCTGAKLANGGFERIGADGVPVGWAANLHYPLLVTDPEAAHRGRRFAKTWHNGRFTQDLQVRAGVPVTIHAWVRGEVPK
ncbi:MAG: right-handed parallel beta-helix repeat-containing protein [Armatimonadetes bacterium]|nr:right-handed parallel beta-helix repeat-containing protein [Armatimonadota bacterium]